MSIVPASVAKGKNLEKKQSEHYARIEKIKSRKPFSSVTLDNSIPKTLENRGAISNPRKFFTKKLLSYTTEQENRCLLQRIGMILTAPPKVTDEHYVKMKLLMSSLKR